MDVAPGMRLGDYRIVAPLGKDGSGHVYQTRDLRHDCDVALRLLTEEPNQDRFAIERFVRDARAASALDHPNIVTVFDVAEAESMQMLEKDPRLRPSAAEVDARLAHSSERGASDGDRPSLHRT